MPRLLLGFVLVCGCEARQACTTEARGSVTVTVTDPDGAPVADPEVTFSVDGGDPAPCDAMPGGSFVCGWEVSGELAITADAWGFGAVTETVTVGRDACHVIPEALTLVLDPVDCTSEEVPSVEVTVAGATGEALTGVVVRYWPEGATADAADCSGPHPPGVWFCGAEQAGALVIEAAADGHVTEQRTVTVGEDECHVITEQVDFALAWGADR